MTDPDASAVGNVVDLADGQVLLPAFVARRDDGLWIDLLAIDSRNLMAQFVERVFAAGARFADLDYELFLNLVFLWEPRDIDALLEDFRRRERPPRLRLARDIVPFPPERRDIYRGVKVLEHGQAAEYLFEQISVEREIEDAEAPEGKRTVTERLYADFDEFVAALWDKGVRFGIDARAVREAIARDKAERIVIAHLKAPTEGKDAGIDEQTDLLHRDDAPRLLPNGRMDLHHYRNRFPQVSAGTRLFRKIPRAAGASGWDVQGKELAPAAVKDFEIETLAGPGTQVVREGGEFVVAAQDGFLDIDAQSGKISVVDKIISREGVSMRTTGDLSLSGDEYEEHGEVQEKRVVEGHNMTFLADIFGKIVSDGGRIAIKQNISGGTAQSPGGSIVVEGAASRAMLEAPRGEVVVAKAEGCVIVAERVRIENAFNCDIVADEVAVEMAAGCAIAAKRVALNTATERKDEATAVTLAMPDVARLVRREQQAADERAAAAAEVERLGQEIRALAEQPEMKTYMTLQPKLKAGTLTMNPKQALQWQELLTRLAPSLRQMAQSNIALKQAHERIAEAERELAAAVAERAAELAAVSCTIATVAGETRVRRLHQPYDAPPLAKLPPKELHKRLRDAGGPQERLFAGASGSFEWQPPTGEEAGEAPLPSGQD